MAEVAPGTECPTCGRKVPHVHDEPPTKRQERFTVLVPPGEEGVLEELLVLWMEKVKANWPEDPGFELGEKGWRYRALHFGMTQIVQNADRLVPSEVGG